MKFLVIILISAFFFPAFGERTSQFFTIRGLINITPVYQSWEIEDNVGEKSKIREQSNLFSLRYPVQENWHIGFSGAQARVSGDVPGLRGLTDLQAYTNYHLSSRNIVLGLQVNFPTGKTKLKRGEFESSLAISHPIFRYRVPNFGQGLKVLPSILWVYPWKETVVVGLGASYHYSGKYTSIENSEYYNPGNEILLTAGIDFRISPTANLSGDFIYTIFGKDTYEGEEIFGAGDKAILNLRLRKYFGYNILYLTGLYRSRAKNDLLVQNRQIKTIPSNFDLQLQYLMRLSGKTHLSILAQGLRYGESETELSDGYILVAGLIPEFKVTDYFSIQLIGKYNTGEFQNNLSLTGFEIGMGLNLNLK
jgi:hypothetical protein